MIIVVETETDQSNDGSNSKTYVNFENSQIFNFIPDDEFDSEKMYFNHPWADPVRHRAFVRHYHESAHTTLDKEAQKEYGQARQDLQEHYAQSLQNKFATIFFWILLLLKCTRKIPVHSTPGVFLSANNILDTADFFFSKCNSKWLILQEILQHKCICGVFSQEWVVIDLGSSDEEPASKTSYFENLMDANEKKKQDVLQKKWLRCRL